MNQRPTAMLCRTSTVLAILLTGCQPAPSALESDGTAGLHRFTVAEAQDVMAAHNNGGQQVTAAYLNRIATIDDAGPMLNAVIATFPDAMAQARARDAERQEGFVRGPLHGVPVLLKDNIEAKGLPTTAGSLALKGNDTGRDAPLIASLRAGGAVLLGKTNLSEWANIRSTKSSSGWSALGGQTKNPHRGDGESDFVRNPCGSSSGSGAAVAAGLAPVAIGTETDGSIVCPASVNGIVGLKPTVGLVSRTHIIPISHSQDTAGPMARCVADAAALLSVIAGSDPADPATAEADMRRTNYLRAIDGASVKGQRIGVLRFIQDDDAALNARFDAALETLRAEGAVLVDIPESGVDEKALGEAEFAVLMAELKADMAHYLNGLPAGLTPMRTLADLIAFNAVTPAEMAYFGQDLFELAQQSPPLDSDSYINARNTARRMAGQEGIDRLLHKHQVDVLVAPTTGTAWKTTLGEGDAFAGPSASQLPAVAGYPHLTVPMGRVRGLPVGFSIIGGAWQEVRLLRTGAVLERGLGGCPLTPAVL